MESLDDDNIEHSAGLGRVRRPDVGLLGAFVLILVGVLGVQLELSSLGPRCRNASRKNSAAWRWRKPSPARSPPAASRWTTGASASAAACSSRSTPTSCSEGRQLLKSLAAPLAGAYLGTRDEMLMVSGFTDDRPVRDSNRKFADNWELSAQRALTVPAR
jgi:hypothetical protein